MLKLSCASLLKCTYTTTLNEVAEFTSFHFFLENTGDIHSNDLGFFARRAIGDVPPQGLLLMCCRSAQGLESDKGSRVIRALNIYTFCCTQLQSASNNIFLTQYIICFSSFHSNIYSFPLLNGPRKGWKNCAESNTFF